MKDNAEAMLKINTNLIFFALLSFCQIVLISDNFCFFSASSFLCFCDDGTQQPQNTYQQVLEEEREEKRRENFCVYIRQKLD
jgi:hypothetical protein